MSGEPSCDQRLNQLEQAVERLSAAFGATYAYLMGRTADELRERWQRTQQELSIGVRRADLHSHTRHSDGAHSVAEMERWRQRAGLDVLGVTDHNTLAHAPDCQPYPRILVGEEVTGRHHHVVFHQPAALIEPEHHLDREVANIRAAGRLPLVAHPTGWMTHRYDGERIASVRDLEGHFMMEIANGAANWFDYRDSTDELAVGLWDQLLLAGRPVVAVGNSDAHVAPNVGLVWNGVPTDAADPVTIHQEISAGHGFVSNGPAALLWVNGALPSLTPLPVASPVTLRLEVADSAGLARWRLVADGATLQEGDAEGRRALALTLDVPAKGARFYRLECVASDGRQAYSNPARLAAP